MTVTIDGATGVSAVQAGAIDPADLPTGSVIQVLQTTTNSQQVFAAGSAEQTVFYDITGLSLSITPTSNSSKILITSTVVCAGTNDAYNLSLGIFRDNFQVGDGGTSGSSSYGVTTSFRSMSQWQLTGLPLEYLDSPSTTSEITYKIKMNNGGGSTYPAYVNRTQTTASWYGNPISTLTLMEIAG